MDARFTPGPWQVLTRPPRYIGEVEANFVVAGPEPRDDTGFNAIARVYTTHGFDGVAERKANAAILAAAPELLEALLIVSSVLSADEFSGQPSFMTQVHAAIAKALGAEQVQP